ncbi:MAG TPA: HAD family phosphatase [Gemmatimonadaceae bacterium]|jgi:putative hydrolase of the HAD superfamily
MSEDSEQSRRHIRASSDSRSHDETIDLVLFDIGGVLGSNGWDREQRAAAVDRFRLDAEDFQYRHEETVGAFESGDITLDEYLDVTVFCSPRDFTEKEFKEFMFAQSEPWLDSIGVARDLSYAGHARLGTLNNESEALNVHRIETFGLAPFFSVFFSSCWLGVRKPTQQIYTRALAMAQVPAERTLFIDDRVQNLRPAAMLGMQTIQFQSAWQLRDELETLGLLE